MQLGPFSKHGDTQNTNGLTADKLYDGLNTDEQYDGLDAGGGPVSNGLNTNNSCDRLNMDQLPTTTFVSFAVAFPSAPFATFNPYAADILDNIFPTLSSDKQPSPGLSSLTSTPNLTTKYIIDALFPSESS